MGDEQLLKEMGIRINARRKRLGWTQEHLAEQMDVSIQMISNLELGRKAIRPENLIKLCTVMHVSADYILCGKNSDVENIKLTNKIAQLSPKHQQIIEMLVDSLIEAPE